MNQRLTVSTSLKRWSSVVVETVVVQSGGETSVCVDIEADEESRIEGVGTGDGTGAGKNIVELELDEQALI